VSWDWVSVFLFAKLISQKITINNPDKRYVLTKSVPEMAQKVLDFWFDETNQPY